MPPMKVGPVIEMAVAVEVSLLVLSILMPVDEALMTPLSVMPPAMVLWQMIDAGRGRDRAGVGDVAGEGRNVDDENADAARRDHAAGAVDDAAREGRDKIDDDAVAPAVTVP